MQLGETIATYDVAAALRGESGKFEVICPNGEIHHINCKPNHSVSNLEWSGHRAGPQPFRVRKVAEPVLLETEKTSAVVQRPALMDEHSSHESKPFLTGNPAGLSVAADDPRSMIANLELSYLETDESANLPSAGIYASTPGQSNGLIPVTSRCTSYNEFDAEVRRLHAQLDEIRSRARKKFYQAHAVAAGA